MAAGGAGTAGLARAALRRFRDADNDSQEMKGRLAAFLQALQQLGWIDGRNVHLDYRMGGAQAMASGCAGTRRK